MSDKKRPALGAIRVISWNGTKIRQRFGYKTGYEAAPSFYTIEIMGPDEKGPTVKVK